MLLTVGFVPVAHEFSGASWNGCAVFVCQPAAVAVPSTAIELGYLAVWWTPAAASGTPASAARSAAIVSVRIVVLPSRRCSLRRRSSAAPLPKPYRAATVLLERVRTF